MTRDERARLTAVLRAAEYLFLENMALKLILEHREVPNWQKLLERMIEDRDLLAGIRLQFSDIYKQLEADPSAALDALLTKLPAPKKRQ